MELTSFSIQRYRSITKTPKLPLGGMTVLVGPNNEGKSNILQAVAVGLRLLQRFPVAEDQRRAISRIRTPKSVYNWERDFPKHLQDSSPDGTTLIDFELNLTEEERTEFKRRVGVNLKTSLPIRLAIGATELELTVRRQGKGYTTLNERRARVARFIATRIRVEHVQSVRTVDAAVEVVTSMVEEQLSTLRGDQAYEDALMALNLAHRPVLKVLEEVILHTLQDFLPDVRDVRVEIPREILEERLALGCRIIVDDGTPTDLQFKGDGVKSLAVLALVRQQAQGYAQRRELVLAVEEPEAHLHPRAIHGIAKVLQEIAETQQVIVTTHSPLLVDRSGKSTNIIVQDKRAFPAPNVAAVREALGVRVSDNLQSAEVALVLEGSSDCAVVGGYLMETYPVLRYALETGVMALDSLSGASNLSARLSTLRSSLCSYHVFLDFDKAGSLAIQRAKMDGLITEAQFQQAIVPGMTESELEDMYDTSVYRSAILNRFGVDVAVPAFRTSKKRWSDRMVELFRANGKVWDDAAARTAKAVAADAVAIDPVHGLHPQRRTVLDALAEALTRVLSD